MKTPALLVVVLAAGAAAAMAMALADHTPAPPASAPRPLPLTAPEPEPAPPDGATLAATLLARPVFAPDRRPDREDTAPGVAGTPAGLPRLTGILVNGADRRAIFAPAGQAGHAQPAVLTVGGRIGLYRVEAISRLAVTLSGPDGRSMLQPQFSDRPAASPVPALSVPAYAIQVPPLKSDPARFLEPVGPLGIAMYRFSPAAPHDAPPVAAALTVP